MSFPTYGKHLLPYLVKPAPLMRRTEMETGPAKQARIAQSRPVKRECRYQFTATEFGSFNTWLDTEGAEGWFDWDDPQDGATKQAMVTLGGYEAEMVPTSDGSEMDWIVNLTLETYE